MKLFFLGILCTLLISTLNNYIWTTTIGKNDKLNDISFTIKNDILEGDYLVLPLTGRCSNEPRSNGQTVAEYFGCDKFQRLINIEEK